MIQANKENVHLYLVDDYNKMQCKIYFIEIRGLQQYLIGYDGEHLLYQQLDELSPIVKDYKPLITIPLSMKDTLLYLFANAAKDNNIRRKDDSIIEGKLIATERHLEDMRDITKKLLKMK